MSDVKKIEVAGTIKEGVSLGIKNIGPILVNVLLYCLTFWIPYINVGTTIGLSVGIISKVSKGEVVPYTEIFDPKYRKYMGEYFLVCGLVSLGVSIGFVFMIIPGIVIGIAWCFALLITVDKGKNPSEAITLSNNATYGNKGRMFCIYLLFFLAYLVIFGLLAAILNSVIGLYVLLTLVICIFSMVIAIGIQASLYKQLTENI
jgi:hypothetical protein